MTEIVPVLLAGGSGTRLWPLSRKSYPKQFSKLVDDRTLFQQAALRLTSSDIVKFDKLLTVTNTDFRFIVGEQLQAVGLEPSSILIEPEIKNTAPAILASTLRIAKDDPDAIILVSPSDHHITDVPAFHQAVQTGCVAARDDKIVTFGIEPTRAETGYGYLELGLHSILSYYDLISFVEKPNKKRAEQMLKEGKYLWNSGIFMFKAKIMIEAFQKYAGDLVISVQKSLNDGRDDLDFFRLEESSWSSCSDISVDYAVLEKADNLCAVLMKSGWSDLGGWDSVMESMSPDKAQNALSGNAHAINCENTMLRSENQSQEIVGIGLSNILAVAMPDAVLVAHKRSAQEVKNAVALLKRKHIKQAEEFPVDHRPWGWFESLTVDSRFQVKRIVVNSGAALSLQSHHHRSEHWIVVEGTAKVTINDDIKLISEGESIYVPLGAMHRMENPGKLPLIIIEVQTGSYLGEDDIIRYDDIYSRK